MIRDRNIAWDYGRFFIFARDFSSVTNIALDGEAANAGVSNGAPDSDGAPIAGDMGATATECWGVDIATVADEISTYIPIGWDWEVIRNPLEFRVWFAHQATDTDAPIWKVHLLPRTAGTEALLPVLDNATEVVTAAALTVSATADVVEKTVWKASTVGTFVAADNFLGISVEADDLGSASANEMNLIGLEIRYTINATTADNTRRVT